MNQFPGCALALGIGFVTIAAVYGSLSILTGSQANLSQEWAALLFQTLLVATPFGLLTFAGVQGRLPWGVGIVLTAIFCGVFLADAIRSRGDANIGMAILMLLSPLLIAAGALSTAHLAKKD